MHQPKTAQAETIPDEIQHPRDWPWRVRELRRRAQAKGDLAREVQILERAARASFLLGLRLGEAAGDTDGARAPALAPTSSHRL